MNKVSGWDTVTGRSNITAKYDPFTVKVRSLSFPISVTICFIILSVSPFIQIGPVIKEVTKLLRSSLPSNIEIVGDIKSESFITGDPVNVHQILMNLCTNAGHAVKDGGRLIIRPTDTIITPRGSYPTTDPLTGNYVELTISDTGEGIPHNIIDNIFERYFTTKGPGEGTGMGLAMVYGIAKNYGGDIQADSVTHRISSVEALNLFRSEPHAFDLVITDMMMPAITGDRMAIELLRIRPDLPIILCTGYSNKISDESAAYPGIKALIFKPVVKADLARAVRNVLDGIYDLSRGWVLPSGNPAESIPKNTFSKVNGPNECPDPS